jgi:hypothetical protein
MGTKTWPLTYTNSVNMFDGGTVAQIIPTSNDTVRFEAAKKFTVTTIPATTWDGTAGNLKYFMTPTINTLCTLKTPAYTASYGYYGGITGDSLDAAFSRGTKSRGDNK